MMCAWYQKVFWSTHRVCKNTLFERACAVLYFTIVLCLANLRSEVVMNLVLDGTRFTFDDKPTQMPTRKWKKMLLEAGGAFSTRIDKADVLVANSMYATRVARALKRGLTIITADEFMTLLQDGSLVLAREDAPETQSMDTLLGEARGLLAQSPSDERWAQLVALVERCDEAQRADFVSYLEDHLSRWSSAVMDEGGRHPTLLKHIPRGDLERPTWREDEALGDVRLAPNDWVLEMSNGVDDVRWRLVYALDNDLQLSAKDFQKILGFEHLVNLRVLRVSQRRMTGAFFKVLSTQENMRTLEHLHLGQMNMRDCKGFDVPESTLSGLRRVCFDCIYMGVEGPMLQVLSETAAMAHVQTLSFQHAEIEQTEASLVGGFPAVHTLILQETQRWFDQPASMPSGLKRVSLAERFWFHRDESAGAEAPILKLIDSPAFWTVPVLDLRQTMSLNQFDAQERERFLSWLLEHSAHLGQYETLVLGEHAGDSICEMFAVKYPDLDVI